MMENNEVMDDIDFRLEKQEEMQMEYEYKGELCSICGDPLEKNQYVYKIPDGTYAHTRCVLNYIDNESLEYEEVMEEIN